MYTQLPKVPAGDRFREYGPVGVCPGSASRDRRGARVGRRAVKEKTKLAIRRDGLFCVSFSVRPLLPRPSFGRVFDSGVENKTLILLCYECNREITGSRFSGTPQRRSRATTRSCEKRTWRRSSGPRLGRERADLRSRYREDCDREKNDFKTEFRALVTGVGRHWNPENKHAPRVNDVFCVGKFYPVIIIVLIVFACNAVKLL